MAGLKPGTKVPALNVPTVGGGTWSLAGHDGSKFLLVDFYRGLHCPKCREHLGTLNKLAPEFAKHGVEVISVSMDEAGRAEKAKAVWGDRRSTRMNSSHYCASRMPSSAC